MAALDFLKRHETVDQEKKAGIKYDLISYEEANHGLTNPEAEALKEKFKGMRLEYNKNADEKSWEDMSKFSQTIFYKF